MQSIRTFLMTKETHIGDKDYAKAPWFCCCYFVDSDEEESVFPNRRPRKHRSSRRLSLRRPSIRRPPHASDDPNHLAPPARETHHRQRSPSPTLNERRSHSKSPPQEPVKTPETHIKQVDINPSPNPPNSEVVDEEHKPEAHPIPPVNNTPRPSPSTDKPPTQEDVPAVPTERGRPPDVEEAQPQRGQTPTPKVERKLTEQKPAIQLRRTHRARSQSPRLRRSIDGSPPRRPRVNSLHVYIADEPGDQDHAMFKRFFGSSDDDKKKDKDKKDKRRSSEKRSSEHRSSEHRSSEHRSSEKHRSGGRKSSMSEDHDHKKLERSKTAPEPTRRQSMDEQNAENKEKTRRQQSKEGGASSAADRPRKSKKKREHKSGRRRRKHPPVHIDINKKMEWPTTPEIILEYHHAKPFLTKNEEWLVMELNEFECMVDSKEIIKIIAKHSKFFEIDPDELWEEFFEFVEEMPSYDEIINYDVWQEFRDKRYPC